MAVPTLVFLDGFEVPVVAKAAASSDLAGLFSNVTNPTAVTLDTSVKRTGIASLKVAEDGVTGTSARKAIASQVLAVSLYFRMTAAPASTSVIVMCAHPTALLKVAVNTSTGTLRTQIGATVGSSGSTAVNDSAWHKLDVLFRSDSTTFSIDYYLDGVAQTGQTLTGQTAANMTEFVMGSSVAGDTATCWYDDLVGSYTVGDFPMPAHHIAMLVPTSEGTDNLNAHIANDSGGTTDLYQSVDDWDGGGAADTTTYLTQTTIDAAAYAEFLFGTSVVEQEVWDVQSTIAGFASTTALDAATVELFDASNASLGVIFAGDWSTSTTVLGYHTGAVHSRPSGAWTASNLLTAKARFGFASDVIGAPRLSAVALQYAAASDATPTPAVCAAVSDVPAPTVLTPDATATPVSVAVLTGIDTPTVLLVTSVTVTPSVVAGVASVGAPSVAADATRGASSVDAVGAVPSPTVGTTGLTIDVVLRSALHSTANTTIYTEPVFWTPLPNSLLIAYIEASGNLVAPVSFVGHNLTWTQVSPSGTNQIGIANRQFAFVALSSISADNTPCQVDFGVPGLKSGCHIEVVECIGAHVSGVAADGIAQAVGAGAGSGTGSVSYGAFSSTRNRPVAFFYHGAQEGTTERTNWTELDDNNFNSPASTVQTQWRDDAVDTAATATWTTTSAPWLGMALEVVADSGVVVHAATPNFVGDVGAPVVTASAKPTPAVCAAVVSITTPSIALANTVATGTTVAAIAHILAPTGSVGSSTVILATLHATSLVRAPSVSGSSGGTSPLDWDFDDDWDTGDSWDGTVFVQGVTGSRQPIIYRLALANRSGSGLGSVIIPDVLGAIGVPGGESPLHWVDTLDDPGSIEFSLPIDHPLVTTATFATGQRELHLYRDDGTGERMVFGGKLWTADIQGWFVRFIGYGWAFDFTRREVTADYSSRIGVDTYKDQLLIVRELVAATQALGGGNLGITNYDTSTSGVTRKLTLCAEERAQLSQVIEDLAAAEDGFDWAVTPEKQLRMWSPRRGTSPSVSFDGLTTMSGFGYSDDATDVVSEFAIIGPKGDDCDIPEIDTATDATALANYGLLQSSDNKDHIADTAWLQQIADEQVRVGRVSAFSPTIAYNADLPGVPSFYDYEVGDIVGVEASRGAAGGFGHISKDVRVISRTVDVARGGIEAIGLEVDQVIA